MVDDVKKLVEPFEILELKDEEVCSLHVTSWHQGEITIYPAHKREGKVINALRVFVPEADKEYFPFYWDITGKTLVAQMVPQLEQPGYERKLFTITKHGIAPKARFTLEVRPA